MSCNKLYLYLKFQFPSQFHSGNNDSNIRSTMRLECVFFFFFNSSNLGEVTVFVFSYAEGNVNRVVFNGSRVIVPPSFNLGIVPRS